MVTEPMKISQTDPMLKTGGNVLQIMFAKRTKLMQKPGVNDYSLTSAFVRR